MTKKRGRKAQPDSNAILVAVRVPPNKYEPMENYVEQTGGSIAAFVREAITEKLQRIYGDDIEIPAQFTLPYIDASIGGADGNKQT